MANHGQQDRYSMSRPFRPKLDPTTGNPVVAYVTCNGSSQEVTFPGNWGPGPHCVRFVQTSGTNALRFRADKAGQTDQPAGSLNTIGIPAGVLEVYGLENIRDAGNMSVYVKGTNTETWELTIGDGI